MSLQDAQAVAIIVFVALSVGAILVITILALLLYSKLGPLLDSARRVASQAEEGSRIVIEDVVKPLAGKAGVAFGVGRLLGFLLGLRRGKGGKRHG